MLLHSPERDGQRGKRSAFPRKTDSDITFCALDFFSSINTDTHKRRAAVENDT